MNYLGFAMLKRSGEVEEQSSNAVLEEVILKDVSDSLQDVGTGTYSLMWLELSQLAGLVLTTPSCGRRVDDDHLPGLLSASDRDHLCRNQVYQ